jgi:[ribosomal protein S5]-alanine N-acetyltransferase
MIRPLSTTDADQLAALISANRAFLRPFTPERPDSFFTPAGQRERLSSPPGVEWRFAILDQDAIAGVISLTNVIRGPFQSANLGYWVDHSRNGRGIATAAIGEVLRFAFETAESKQARSSKTSHPSAYSRRTDSSRSASPVATYASPARGAITCSSSAWPTRGARETPCA